MGFLPQKREKLSKDEAFVQPPPPLKKKWWTAVNQYAKERFYHNRNNLESPVSGS